MGKTLDMKQSDALSKLKRLTKGLQTIVCDDNGLIMAESVYRCLVCEFVDSNIHAVRFHYHDKHQMLVARANEIVMPSEEPEVKS